MSKLNIRLPQFLSEVDALTANMSQRELQAFVHEMARTWSEKGRQSFVELLKTYSGKVLNECESEKNNDYANAVKEIKNIIEILTEINDGDRVLDSEYNEEWDDWYNSDADEVLFSDPDGLIRDIDLAIKYVHYCVDTQMYKEGCELAEMLSLLEVSAEGDYNDFDGSPLGVCSLDEYDLLNSDYDTFVNH